MFSRSLTRSILPRPHVRKIGATPGIEHAQLAKMPVEARVPVSCVDYGPGRVETCHIGSPEEMAASERPEWAAVRWINVDGLTDTQMIHALAKKYHLHPLAIEDVLHVPQRPKVEAYGGDDGTHQRLFVIARMLRVIEGHLQSEQVSIFVGAHTVITLQEAPGDVWDPIRVRINTAGTRLRGNDASFLMYALLDAIVDHCMPLLNGYCGRLEALEEAMQSRPRPEIIREIQEIKRELMLLRREFGPIREVITSIQRDRHDCVSETTRMYLRDVQDHITQTIDLVETYREVAQGLAETYNATVAIRANEVMRLLTLVATIFIPVTFITGLFGMNFPFPGGDSAWAFPTVCTICALLIATMLLYFHRRSWI